jgi:hypothetical protein
MTDKYIKPSRDTAARMLGGEMIVMSVKDSRVFTLNATASRIWKAADGYTPLGKLCTGGCAERLAESGHDNRVQRMEVE